MSFKGGERGSVPLSMKLNAFFIAHIRDAPISKKCSFFEHCSNGGGGQPMFKNFVGNCRSFWRSFNNMKFA